ncbi:MAG: transporter [Candidatus Saccharibacteria bacterium]|nr:transporter [Candidatus Saccharibacteria bacterium]
MVEKVKQKLSERNEKRALPLVVSTIFLDVLGVGILGPVLPQLIFRIFEPAGYSYHSSLIMLGWLVFIYPFMQFIATPILGQLSDRYGRKPILAFSLFGTAVGYVLFAIAIITKNIPLLFFARALDGITGGNISVARAVIADVSPPEHRTKNFAKIGAAFGAGFVFGPYIGARLASPGVSFFGLFNTPHWFSPAVPFWFAAILSAINAYLVITILPETHQHINDKLRLTWNKSLDNIKRAALHPALRIILSAEFAFWGGFTFFTSFFQILLIQKLGFKVNNVGDYYAYIGIWVVLAQAIITPFIAKKVKNANVLRFSLLGNGITLFALILPHNTAQLLLVTPFFAIFNGLTIANLSTLVSLNADKKIQGEVLGIEASVQALAQSIPAAIAGYIAVLGVNIPVIVGGSVVVFGGLIFNIFYHQPKGSMHDSDAAPLGAGH